MKIKIYVGCSLTHAPQEYKDGIEELKVELRKKYEILEFIGLIKGTPVEVFEHDTNCVRQCDLFLADVSHPAIGVGYELGTALALNKPVLAVAQQDAKVGRLVLGVTHPKFSFKRYDKLEEVVDLVEEKLKEL